MDRAMSDEIPPSDFDAVPLAPGDEAPADTAGSDEGPVCPDCGGSGQLDNDACPRCGGSGRLAEA